MDKKIVVKMYENRDISIFRNDEEVLKIQEAERKIKASDVYKVLDYTKGDTYSVDKENPKSLDTPVLDFLTDLFSDICKKLNDLSSEQLESQPNAQQEKSGDIEWIDETIV